MTDIEKEVFEKYEIRKTRKQKNAFIDYVSDFCTARGYEARIEQGAFGARNIVVGDPTRAKVTYTAHYDTCPVLPFPNFITPKCFPIYLIYQIGLVLLIFAAAAIPAVLAYFIAPPFAALVFELAIWGILAFMLFGPANKHTANDNTSGVLTLLRIIDALPECDRKTTAFIFFDLEETGLIGSMSYAGQHRGRMDDRLVVNYDCVSDGENLLIVLNKRTSFFFEAFKSAFRSDGRMTAEVVSKGVFYPSDQSSFKMGVGVAALKSTKGGLLYMNRIHTPRDTVYREENIDFLVEASLRLAATEL